MPDINQLLSNTGINPFAITLVAESVLQSPAALKIAQMLGGGISFEYPIRRSDCPGHVGVRFTLEPIPEGQTAPFSAGTYELGAGYQLVLESQVPRGITPPAGQVLRPVHSAVIYRSDLVAVAVGVSSDSFAAALLKLATERKKLSGLPLAVVNPLANIVSRAGREAMLSLVPQEKKEAPDAQ